MSRVAHEFVPAELTSGEIAALLSASPQGWITPPLYCSWAPNPVRPWRSVHLRYLERRGLIGKHRIRIDGAGCVQLNAAGLAIRASLT